VDIDDPRERLNVLPMFRPPPTRQLDPAIPDSPSQPASDSPQSPPRPYVPPTPKPDHGDTRTPISSGGEALHKPTPGEATALVVGILGLVVAGAAWWVSRRPGRRLREPTKTQSNDIAAPIARIALRHADLSWLGDDVADALKAAAATGAYLNSGPLIITDGADSSGVPDNLQEDQ